MADTAPSALQQLVEALNRAREAEDTRTQAALERAEADKNAAKERAETNKAEVDYKKTKQDLKAAGQKVVSEFNKIAEAGIKLAESLGAQATKGIELEIQDNSKSLKAQYKEAVAELQNVSAQYGETSQQAIKAAKAAADLKDQIGFSKDLVDSFNPDAKFNALSKSVGGVLDGFQAFEGALGLVGVESKSLQETMVRLQSVMALSQGLQGLMEAKDSFKQLGTVALDALKGIRTGLAATGIGLFLVALGTIVAYWDDIKAAVSGVTEEQKKLNEESHKNFETSKEQLTTLDAQDNILKLQGKSEREILNLKIAKVNTAIELGKIELQNVIKTSKAEEEAAIKNYNLTKKIVDFTLDAALFLPKLMLKASILFFLSASQMTATAS